MRQPPSPPSPALKLPATNTVQADADHLHRAVDFYEQNVYNAFFKLPRLK